MTLKVLFIPVSSAKGIGEYMRSLSIAEALVARYSDIDIQFVLSQKAPFHTTCPFSVVLTPSSPTKHPKKVTKVIESFKPFQYHCI